MPSIADEVSEVNGLLDQNEKAFVRGDVKVLLDTLSDRYIGVMDFGGPEGAFVIGKEQLKGFMTEMESQDTEFDRETLKRDVTIDHDVAVVNETARFQWGDGEPRVLEQIKIVCRDGNSWKLVLDFPLFFRSNVVVTEVPSKSAAAKIGLKNGDVVTFYADREIQTSSQWETALKEHAKYPVGTKFVLRVGRGEKEKEFKVDPGMLGATTETRLVPDKEGQYIGPDGKHPIKEILQRMLEASKSQDVAALRKEMSVTGFVLVTKDEKGTSIVGPDNFEEAFKKGLEQATPAADLSSLSIDEVRCLVENNLGLAEVKISLKFKDGTSKQTGDTYLFLRQNQRWLLAAEIPLRGTHIGEGLRN
jgi:hypothetical protein